MSLSASRNRLTNETKTMAEEFGEIKKSEPIKNMYNKQFLDRFAKDLKLVIHDFDSRKFVSQVMDKERENRELKQKT
jgi:hypothetical protein